MQRTFLELTHNPFAPPREGFYSGADRKTHLDHIRHLSQWSRRVLLVTGPFGIGKSTLFKELSTSLPGSAKGARVSGAVVTGEREVLLAIMQGLGMAIEQDMHMEDIIVLLVRHVDEEASRERMCVVMFDDAHLLAHTAVSLLMRLVAESAIRVVMFAEPSLITNVNQSAKKYEVEWFEIRLSGFPAQDVRDYLEWRFAQAQYRGRLPFTDPQVAKIAERSGGNPNVIDFMANELLADLETGQVRELGGRFPKRHALLVVILAILVFLIYQLYLQPPLEDGAPIEIASIENEVSVAGQNDSPGTEKDTDALDGADGVVSEDGIETGLEEGPGVTDATEVESTDESVLSESANSSGENGVAEFVAAPVLAPDELRDELRDQLRDESRDELSVSEEPLEPPLPDDAPPEITPEEVVSVQPPVRESPIPVVDSIARERPSTTTIPSVINGPAWLRGQNDAHYTLQLMTLSRQQGGVDLIKRQSDSAEFAMYPLRRNGKTMYVVTYGVFSNQAAAQRAASGLTGELAGITPWVRPFSAVQDAISD